MSAGFVELNLRDESHWGLARKELRCDVAFGVVRKRRFSELGRGAVFVHKGRLYRKTCGIMADLIGANDSHVLWPIPVRMKPDAAVEEFLYRGKEASGS